MSMTEVRDIEMDQNEWGRSLVKEKEAVQDYAATKKYQEQYPKNTVHRNSNFHNLFIFSK